MAPLSTGPSIPALPFAPERADRELHDATRPFAQDSQGRSWAHVASTISILAAALAAAALLPWWPARLAASLLAALVLVRAFILYHDFMHGAILPGSGWARVLFNAYGALVLVPSRSWRDSHNFHHANVGRLRGSDVGAFPLMTARAWCDATPRERLVYRIERHPVTLLCAYVTVFLINVCLLPLVRSPRRHWDSALSLLAHGGAIAALWVFLGFDAALFGVLVPMAVSCALGGYIFYAQHSFPGMRILPEEQWTPYRASLVSASYLRMSPVMHWFTGNIGYHHVHHLNQLIPFYELPRAMAEIPELRHPTATTLHPRDLVACFRASLWDEASGRMVRYRDVPIDRRA